MHVIHLTKDISLCRNNGSTITIQAVQTTTQDPPPPPLVCAGCFGNGVASHTEYIRHCQALETVVRGPDVYCLFQITVQECNDDICLFTVKFLISSTRRETNLAMGAKVPLKSISSRWLCPPAMILAFYLSTEPYPVFV